MWIATNPERWDDQVVGDGHCVRLVQEAAAAPHTSAWRRGARVRDVPDLARGAVIATFDRDGSYGSRTDGSCHAAIFLRHEPEGLRVRDQWRGHPCSERTR